MALETVRSLFFGRTFPFETPGSDKEHWEPTLEKIFTLQSNNCPPIVDAWSFDWQNHGDGAVVNQKVLETREPGILPQEWAQALISFLNTGIVSKRRLVAIGHSTGATTFILMAAAFAGNKKPIDSMILVEPPLLPRKAYERSMREGSAVVLRKAALRKAILNRRDTWPSRKYALEWFGARAPWKLWDKQILQIYVDHGLKTIPLSNEHNVMVETLKCSAVQEEAGYVEAVTEDSLQAYELLPSISSALPVHVILGERDDLMPRYTQDLLVREAGVASATRIPNAGHLVVQEAPLPLAEAIAGILRKDTTLVSKL